MATEVGVLTRYCVIVRGGGTSYMLLAVGPPAQFDEIGVTAGRVFPPSELCNGFGRLISSAIMKGYPSGFGDDHLEGNDIQLQAMETRGVTSVKVLTVERSDWDPR